VSGARSLLLDVSRLIWRRWIGRLPTGIDRVCLAYLAHYGPQALAVVQRGAWRKVLDARSSQQLFALLSEPGPDFRSRLSRLMAGRGVRRIRAEQIAGGLYLNVGHTGLESTSLARWIKQHDLRAVYLIHDLIPISHPEYCRAGEAERHAQRMTLVLDTAAGVIGNSEQTLFSLDEFAARRGSAMPATVPALLGSDLPAPRREKPVAARPTFVMIGTIEGRKNHLLMLQLWTRLAQVMGAETPELVIIGQRGWESEQAVDLLERAPALRGHVQELSRCSDAELADHLSGARALLFPSLVEGYGLPLIEALHEGTPVIASDIPVFREIGGAVPDYVDPLDGPSWLRVITAYAAQPSEMRDAQLARLQADRAPTWSDHFAKIDPWLAEIAGSVPPHNF
jgi:glycosyltransferase involved in cell wall biosynthesis